MNDEDNLLEPLDDDQLAVFIALFDLRRAVDILSRDIEIMSSEVFKPCKTTESY